MFRQQAYRERREQQVEALREQVTAAEKQCANQQCQIQDLKSSLIKLRREREHILKHIRPTCTASNSITGPSVDLRLETLAPDQDDLLAYATVRKHSV